MDSYMYKAQEKFFHMLIKIFKDDMVLAISFLLAFFSCFVSAPKLEYVDFNILTLLFSLMVVIKAFEDLKLLDRFAIAILNKCSNSRQVSGVLIFLCFFSAMFITNDVALITFVPLTLIIANKSKTSMLETIVLQTLAANIGSSLTPMGNPQNLYIFSHYHLPLWQFLKPVSAFVLLGGIWLYLLNHKKKAIPLDISLSTIHIKDKKKAVLWTIWFLIIIAAILGFVEYSIILTGTLCIALWLDKSLIKKVDYLLLLTFICFFIFIGNISSISGIYSHMKQFLDSTAATYFSSIFFSQLISNVPATMLLSSFTDDWKALLLGVNVGGMGTLIASLASVISYKLFIKEHPKEAKLYLLKFTVYNFFSLILFTALNYIILITML